MQDRARKLSSYKRPISPLHPVFVVEERFELSDSTFAQRSKSLGLFKRRLSLARESWGRFCRTTTGHGFGRIVDKAEPLVLRLFWVLAVISCLVAMLYSVAVVTEKSLISRSLRSEVTQVRNSSMELPDIHVCDTSLFNRTVLANLGFSDEMASYLALTLSSTISASSLRNDVAQQKRLQKNLDDLLRFNGLTLDEVLKRSILGCMDFIMGCVHQTISYTREQCCSEMFRNRTYPNIMGSCVSTHGIEHFVEHFASQVYGFTVFLRSNIRERLEYDTMVVSPIIGSKLGAVYAVSDHLSDVSVIIPSKGQYATPATWNSIAIGLTRTDNTEWIDSPLAPRFCIPTFDERFQSRVPGFDFYSHENCVHAAIQTQFQTDFNCSVYGLPHTGSFPYCHPSVLVSDTAQIIANQAHYRENCPEDCVTDAYTTIPSAAIMVLSEHDDMHAIPHNDSDLVGLHFYFPAFTFSVIKNHPQSFVTWLGEVGGNMGLYLGASLVTVLEFVVAFILLILRCCRPPAKTERRRKKLRVSRIIVQSKT